MEIKQATSNLSREEYFEVASRFEPKMSGLWLTTNVKFPPSPRLRLGMDSLVRMDPLLAWKGTLALRLAGECMIHPT